MTFSRLSKLAVILAASPLWAEPAAAVPAAPAPQPPAATEESALLRDGTLHLSLDDALFLALRNNPSLRAQRLAPQAAAAGVEAQEAAFDPVLKAQLGFSQSSQERLARAGSAVEQETAKAQTGSAEVSQKLESGTTVGVNASVNRTENSLYSAPFSSTRAGVSVTQNLLRGFGSKANTVLLRQARLDETSSWYELKAFASALAAETELAYLEAQLADSEVLLQTEALKLSRESLAEIEERVKAGVLAPVELPAARADVAAGEAALIDARAATERARLRLIRLSAPVLPSRWTTPVVLTTPPTAREEKADAVEEHVAIARRLRPDLAQARLEWDRRQLDVVRTKDGLLPKLDFFINLGMSGFGRHETAAARQMDRHNYDGRAGLTFEMPLGNRAAEAADRRAGFDLRRSVEAMDNLSNIVEEEVRAAWIETDRARQQIPARAAARLTAEEALRAETEKLRAGRGTAFQTAQARQRVLEAKLAETRAASGLRSALVELFRRDGSFPERRGIQLPVPEL